ncbi:MAG: hypothetical protein HW401_831 [Parcubacteria group bacterium]|nr:hypothetical protein [Parcubacteria group bacterium]
MFLRVLFIPNYEMQKIQVLGSQKLFVFKCFCSTRPEFFAFRNLGLFSQNFTRHSLWDFYPEKIENSWGDVGENALMQY